MQQTVRPSLLSPKQVVVVVDVVNARRVRTTGLGLKRSTELNAPPTLTLRSASDISLSLFQFFY
jgi:hypothetical protein